MSFEQLAGTVSLSVFTSEMLATIKLLAKVLGSLEPPTSSYYCTEDEGLVLSWEHGRREVEVVLDSSGALHHQLVCGSRLLGEGVVGADSLKDMLDHMFSLECP